MNIDWHRWMQIAGFLCIFCIVTREVCQWQGHHRITKIHHVCNVEWIRTTWKLLDHHAGVQMNEDCLGSLPALVISRRRHASLVTELTPERLTLQPDLKGNIIMLLTVRVFYRFHVHFLVFLKAGYMGFFLQIATRMKDVLTRCFVWNHLGLFG